MPACIGTIVDLALCRNFRAREHRIAIHFLLERNVRKLNIMFAETGDVSSAAEEYEERADLAAALPARRTIFIASVSSHASARQTQITMHPDERLSQRIHETS